MSVFPYTGNKACIYPLIEDMTPDHDVYIEAFCGSAEVFFQKRPVKKEIINDYSGDVIHFFRTLQDHEKLAYLIGHIFLSGNCEEMFKENRRLLTSIPNILDDAMETAEIIEASSWDDVKRASAFFETQLYSFSSTGTSYAIRGVNIVPRLFRLVAASNRLKQAAILHRDYKKVLLEQSCPNSFIFCDPPYVTTEDMYKKGCFGAEDHIELFRIVKLLTDKFHGSCKIMITYNDCEFVRELAAKHGLYYYTKARLHNMQQATKPGAQFIEAIITNYDADEVMDKKIYCHTRQGEQMTLFDIFEDEERNYYNAEN